MRPMVELATTMSLTASHRSPSAATSSAGSSTSSSSPANARRRPSSSESASIEVRKPTRPRFTPSTGTPLPRKRRSARSIVPSPPSTTARSAVAMSAPPPSPCFAASSSGSSSSIWSSATARSCSSASPLVSGRPCVITATRLISGSGVGDPVFELIGILRPLALDEMQEELAVPLRAGQAGVYDADHLCPPLRRVASHLAQHAPPDVRVADDAAGSLGATRLELRLHEHDRLPPRRGQREPGPQRLAHADERDVADDELRRERQLRRLPHVRSLQHRHTRVGADARMQLPVADVERDHARGAALQQHVGEAAGRRADVESITSGDVDLERVERVVELLAAARDKARRLGHGQLGRLLHLLAGLLVARHATGQHQRLRLGAALGEPALDEQDVEAFSQEVRTARSSTMPSSTVVSASISVRAARARSAVSSARTRAASAPRSRT